MKKTQSNKKLREYFEDLIRNEYFCNDLKRFVKILDDMVDGEKETKNANKIFISKLLKLKKEYQKLDNKARQILKKHESKLDKFYNEIFSKYKLSRGFLRAFSGPYILETKEDQYISTFFESIDMAIITDFREDYLESNNKVPIAIDVEKQDTIRHYPVNLAIHLFAGENDVIDFIKKNWKTIENIQKKYRGDKKLNVRKKRISRQISDFIWNSRHLKTEEIKALMDKEIPGNKLIYSEILNIKKIEKQRRTKR